MLTKDDHRRFIVVRLRHIPGYLLFKHKLLPSERQFAQFHNQPKAAKTECRARQRNQQAVCVRFLVHQFRHPPRGQHTGNRAADGDRVRQDEMVDVNEGARNEQAHENPQAQHLRPPQLDQGPWIATGGKIAADLQKDEVEHHTGEQLDEEITHRNFPAAVRALAAQQQPAQQRNVLPHRDLVFARRAEAAARLVHRNAQRQAVNDHVQERADASADVEGQEMQQGVEDLESRHDGWRSLQTCPAVREYGSKNSA